MILFLAAVVMGGTLWKSSPFFGGAFFAVAILRLVLGVADRPAWWLWGTLFGLNGVVLGHPWLGGATFIFAVGLGALTLAPVSPAPTQPSPPPHGYPQHAKQPSRPRRSSLSPTFTSSVLPLPQESGSWTPLPECDLETARAFAARRHDEVPYGTQPATPSMSSTTPQSLPSILWLRIWHGVKPIGADEE